MSISSYQQCPGTGFETGERDKDWEDTMKSNKKGKKGGIYRFRTIAEQKEWELINRLENGQRVDEFDRYEYIRLKIKAYPPGIYRFKTLKEKQEDEFKRVIETWGKQLSGEDR